MGGGLAILVVDDGPGDRRLMVEALREHAPQCRVDTASDGEEALAYLYKAGVALPAMIFLDLNMPRVDGREVLRTIKSDPLLRQIPVIVFTTSEEADDILSCYRNHANSVLTKPMNIDEFGTTVTTLVNYWLGTVQIPASLNKPRAQG